MLPYLYLNIVNIQRQIIKFRDWILL